MNLDHFKVSQNLGCISPVKVHRRREAEIILKLSLCAVVGHIQNLSFDKINICEKKLFAVFEALFIIFNIKFVTLQRDVGRCVECNVYGITSIL